MRTIGKRVVLILGAALGPCIAAEPLPACTSGLTPTSTVPPRLPPRLHNEFSGKVQVAFVVSPAGRVRSPALVSAEWHPAGRSTGQPIGYSEAILSAVNQWRYPHRQHPCQHQISIELRVDEPDTTAGRSKRSFKQRPLRGLDLSGPAKERMRRVRVPASRLAETVALIRSNLPPAQ